MTQEKMRRIITACVCAATVLLVFLLGFLVYQLVTINVLNNRIESTKTEIAYYEEKLAEGKDDLEYYQSDLGKYIEALKLGFINNQQGN